MAIIGALTLDNGIAIYTVDLDPTIETFESAAGSIAILQNSNKIFIKGTGSISDWTLFGLITDINSVVNDASFAAPWQGVTDIAPSKNAVYNEMILKLNLSGGSMTGDIDMNSNNIFNVKSINGIDGGVSHEIVPYRSAAMFGPGWNNIRTYVIGGGTYDNPDLHAGLYFSPSQYSSTIYQTSGSQITTMTQTLNGFVFTLGSTSSGGLGLTTNEDSHISVFRNDTITDYRTYQLPNNNGTIALLSDLSTYSNGLTLTSNIVELGGELTKNTLISSPLYGIYFGNDTTKLDNFNIYSKISLNNKSGGFNVGGTGFDSDVKVIETQSDGKIIVGGSFFSMYNGIACPISLVRLNLDGSIDNTFNTSGTGFDDSVYTIVIQSDDKILIGGFFSTYNGITCSRGLVRLNSDGSIDNTFNTSGTGFDDYVYIIHLNSDGSFLIGGNFTSYNGVNCPKGLIRLNSNGSIDSTFNSGNTGFNEAVVDIKTQTDNKILVSGGFITYNGSTVSKYLVRLNSNGSIDSTFNSGGLGFSSNTQTVEIQSDGKIIVGGNFKLYNSITCNTHIVRLNLDGSIDSTFNSGGTGFDDSTQVKMIDIQSDDSMFVVGGFNTYNGSSYGKIIKLNSDGTANSYFNAGGSGFDIDVSALKVQTNGKILVGGYFTTYNTVSISNNIVRLVSFGDLDWPVTNTVLFDGEGVLRYYDSYHDQYTNRTLVDKEYVDMKISSTGEGYNGIVFDLDQLKYKLDGNFTTYSTNYISGFYSTLSMDSGGFESNIFESNTNVGTYRFQKNNLYFHTQTTDNTQNIQLTLTAYGGYGIDVTNNANNLSYRVLTGQMSVNGTENGNSYNFQVTSSQIYYSTTNNGSNNTLTMSSNLYWAYYDGTATSSLNVSSNNITYYSQSQDNYFIVSNSEFEVKMGGYDIFNLRNLKDNAGQQVLNWDNGYVKQNYTVISNDYSVLSTDYFIEITDVNNIIITLPPAANNTGQELLFKHNDRNSFTSTITAQSGELIDDNNTTILASAYANIKLISNGTKWLITSI